MSNNNMQTTFKKASSSKDVLTSGISEGRERTLPSDDLKIDGPSVTTLKEVDNDILKNYVDLRSSIELQVQRQFAEGKFVPGRYQERGTTYFVVPDSLMCEDNIIGAMIYDLAKQVGAEVRILENYATKTTMVFDKKFFTGLWFGMFSSISLKRRRAKQSYEMGRACAFSLIVKNIFESEKSLGPKALAKDNFFYGNNPGESSTTGKVPFYLKTKLFSSFESPIIANLIYGILNYVASEIGLTNLTDDERINAIFDNLIPVDQVIASCYPTISTKRGRQVVKESRKPNPIRNSPLFLKEEMQLISSLSSYIFTDLGAFTTDYLDTVSTHGFDFVQNHIRSIINVRLETLQRFAHVTKERLQGIRKHTGKSTIRKAGVTQDDVMSFLKSLPDPAQRLRREMIHIMGRADIRLCYTYAFKRECQDSLELDTLLYIQSLELYQTIPNLDKIKDLQKPATSGDPRPTDYDQSVKALREISEKCGKFSDNLKNIRHIRAFTIFSRTDQIKGLKNNIITQVRGFMLLPKLARDTAVKMYFNQEFRDSSDYVYHIQEYLNQLQDESVKTIQLRAYEENRPDVKTTMTSLLETIKASFEFESGSDRLKFAEG